MAKTEKLVNLAVIGSGYWGRKVISEYMQLEEMDSDFNLVQICDLKPENLDYCRDVLHVDSSRLTSELEMVLKSPKVNAVHICTPNETHCQFGLWALSNEKNVLLEKPMALSAEDAWNLVHVADSKGLCLQVGHIYRFNRALKRVRDLIARNYFGNLYYLKLQWTTWMPSPLGRDIIFDLGPHPIDILHFLLKKWPLYVHCSANSYRRPSLEEVAFFDLNFGKKLMAHVELSWLQPGKVRELNIIGSNRSATIDCLGQSIRVFEDNNGGNFVLGAEENNTIFDEVQHFVESIRNDNNHKNPGVIGAGNVEVLDCLRKSLGQKEVVKVGLRD